jgi:hypothetical protein
MNGLRIIDGNNSRYIVSLRVYRAGGNHERRTIREWSVVRFTERIREELGTRSTLRAATQLVRAHEG